MSFDFLFLLFQIKFDYIIFSFPFLPRCSVLNLWPPPIFASNVVIFNYMHVYKHIPIIFPNS